MSKQNIMLAIGAGIIVIALIIIMTNQKNNRLDSLSPQLNSLNTPTATPTVSPRITDLESPTPRPTPGVIMKEVKDFQYWFSSLDPQNRVLGVYSECTLLVPSNVAYKNNTQIMLDNTRSMESHVLKIGSTEYNLKAGDWVLTTLSSSTLPARMTIFCEGIELGQIDLEQ